MAEEDKTWNFDNQAARYDESVANGSNLHARYNEVLDRVVQVAEISPGKRALDIGTGTGNLALRCLALGAEVVGLDPSERMLAEAREKASGYPDAAFHQVQEPFLSIPYPDKSFDVVMSTYAYHHIPHRLKPDSVREMIRVLKPGGIWALGDLVFENEKAERKALQEHRWLEEEYFVRIEEIQPLFLDLGMDLHAQQFTPVTWVLWAIKPG